MDGWKFSNYLFLDGVNIHCFTFIKNIEVDAENETIKWIESPFINSDSEADYNASEWIKKNPGWSYKEPWFKTKHPDPVKSYFMVVRNPEAPKKAMIQPKGGVVEDSELDCLICFERYDDKANTPLSLQCGHTCCKRCISAIFKTGIPIRCPLCKVP